MIALRFRRAATRSWSSGGSLVALGVVDLPDDSDVGVEWAEVIWAVAVIADGGKGGGLRGCWPRGGEFVEVVFSVPAAVLDTCWSGKDRTGSVSQPQQ